MNDWDEIAPDADEYEESAPDSDADDEFVEDLVGDDEDEPSDDDAVDDDDDDDDAGGRRAIAPALTGSPPTAMPTAPTAPVRARSLPPRPILVRDKMVSYLSLARFDEFADLATVYGDLLRTRYAETRLPPDLQELAIRFPDTLHMVAVVAEGDPDTAAVLPIIARLVDASERLDLRIIEDEDEDDLRPLTLIMPALNVAEALDEWDLPQVFVFDEEWEVQAQWGPRPAAADARVETWLAANPDYEALDGDESPASLAAHAELTHTLLYEMRVWYNSGLGRACLDEWRDLLTGLLAPDELDTGAER